MEFGHINPKTTNVFLTPCLRDAAISFGFKKMPVYQDGVRRNQRSQIFKTKTQTRRTTQQNLFKPISSLLVEWI